MPALHAQRGGRIQPSGRSQRHRAGVDGDGSGTQLGVHRAAGQPVGGGGQRAGGAVKRSGAQVECAHRVRVRSVHVQNARARNRDRRAVGQLVVAAQGQRAAVDVDGGASGGAVQGRCAAGDRYRARAEIGRHRAALQRIAVRRECLSAAAQDARTLRIGVHRLRAGQRQLSTQHAQGCRHVQPSGRTQRHRAGVDRDGPGTQPGVHRAAGQAVGGGGQRTGGAIKCSGTQVECAHRVRVRSVHVQNARARNRDRRAVGQLVVAAQGQRAAVDVDGGASGGAVQGRCAAGDRYRARAEIGRHRAALQRIAVRRECLSAAAQDARTLRIGVHRLRAGQRQLSTQHAQGCRHVQPSGRTQRHRAGVDRDGPGTQLRVYCAAGQPVGGGGQRAGGAVQRAAAHVEGVDSFRQAVGVQGASGNRHRRRVGNLVGLQELYRAAAHRQVARDG